MPGRWRDPTHTVSDSSRLDPEALMVSLSNRDEAPTQRSGGPLPPKNAR